MRRQLGIVVLIVVIFLIGAAPGVSRRAVAEMGLQPAEGIVQDASDRSASELAASGVDATILENSKQLLKNGRETFRYGTFGHEAFWGDLLQLHKSIEGAKLGGVGLGVSPRTAFAVGASR